MTSPQPRVLPETTTAVQVRFSDTDMMGHVSSGSYAAWAEVGRADFFRAFDAPENEIPWFVLVHLGLDFHSEGHFGTFFSIHTRCVEIGGKSITLEQRITAGDSQEAAAAEGARPVCTVKVVMACFDKQTRKARPVPEGWTITNA